MAFIEQAHLNDIGTIFRVTVYDTTSSGGTSVADISTASTKQFTFKRPNGTTLNHVEIKIPNFVKIRITLTIYAAKCYAGVGLGK